MYLNKNVCREKQPSSYAQGQGHTEGSKVSRGNALLLYNFWPSGVILIFYRFVYLTKVCREQNQVSYAKGQGHT